MAPAWVTCRVGPFPHCDLRLLVAFLWHPFSTPHPSEVPIRTARPACCHPDRLDQGGHVVLAVAQQPHQPQPGAVGQHPQHHRRRLHMRIAEWLQ